MNLKVIILFSLFSLLQAHHANGAITTIYFQAYTNGTRSSTVTVKSNEIAQVRYHAGGFLIVNDGTTSYKFFPETSSPWNIPLIAGPVTIYLESETVTPGYTNVGICTISVTALADPSSGISIPSNSVVIPADSGGPVQIILESSADLISWTASMPGTYGAQTQTRFFRVRAQRVAN